MKSHHILHASLWMYVVVLVLAIWQQFNAIEVYAAKKTDIVVDETISGAKEQEKARANKFKKDEIIVKYKGEGKFKREKVLPFETVESAVEKHRKNPQVEYAEPDFIGSILEVPSDAYYKYQWHLDNGRYGGINAEEAWETSHGEGVVVAVIDTGVAYEDYDIYQVAPDLAGTSFVPGYDLANEDSHPNDDHGHGTHVAGTIAQTTNNSVGTAGVAHGASIMPIKVIFEDGSGYISDMAEGVIWAADNGADVINISLGWSATSTAAYDALAYAHAKGVTIVAAAGNYGTTEPVYPAAYDEFVISVGATGFSEKRARYSSYGPSVDLVAPGGDTTNLNGDDYVDFVLQQTFASSLTKFHYEFKAGTSMAAPHVAATAALIKASGRGTGPEEIRQVLQTTADDLGVLGEDDIYGWGIVNAAFAVSPAGKPYASAGADVVKDINLNATFNGGKSRDLGGSIQSYHWDFGDGTSAIGKSKKHAYTQAGVYSVTLTVTDNSGETDTDTLIATITDPNAPGEKILFDETFANLKKWLLSGVAWKTGAPKEKPVEVTDITGTVNKVAFTGGNCGASGCILSLRIPLDLTPYSSATLTFLRYTDNELDEGEFLKAEIYDGSQWFTLAEWGTSDPFEDTWVQESFDLTPHISNVFQVRFSGYKDQSKEDIQIENVRIIVQ